jgi:hypothetical protein
VTSIANLGQEVTVTPQGKYVPAVGQKFTIVTADNELSGTFANVIGPSGRTYDATYTNTKATATRTA